MNKMQTVIVVGGGAAGIAAATSLYENGVKEVLVLEAENRIGGRIHTINIDEEIIELGAQWIHGEKNNVVFEMVSDRNLHFHSDISYDNMLFVQSSANIIDKNISEKIIKLFEVVRKPMENVQLEEYKSSGDYFLAKIKEKFIEMKKEGDNLSLSLMEQLIEWFHQFINTVDGSDTWFDSSITTLNEYWNCPGNSFISWKEGGYKTILSILMEKCQNMSGGNFIKQNIIMNSEVSEVCVENSNICVKCTNGSIYYCKYVIVTVSLGVLKEKFQKLFGPEILSPKKITAIKGLSIGSVNKMYLKFPYQWWPSDINGFNFLWTKEDRKEYLEKGQVWLTNVMSFLRVDHAPLLLCGWVCGHSSRIMEQLDENEVKSQLTQLLRKFLGKNYTIPEPVLIIRTTWSLNDHFKGSYSFRSPITDKLNVTAADLASPLYDKYGNPVILFAGEATHDHYYSTVHGAIETGWREANRVLSMYKK